MAIDIESWRNLIIKELESISDASMQRESWFGRGQIADSPTEQICALFDDLNIVNFIDQPGNGLGLQGKKAFTKLIRSVDELVDDPSHKFRATSLIDDPRWITIRDQAKTALIFMNNISPLK